MNIWDWAVKAHQAPGVDAALIEVQDVHGQCVSFLLWAAWTAKAGRPLDAAVLARGAMLARGWESEVTVPLRAVRRVLKRDWAGIAETDREALRSAVKQDEFEAERRLLEALAALSPAGAEEGASIAARLRLASAAWTSLAPADALDRLAVMFEAVDFC